MDEIIEPDFFERSMERILGEVKAEIGAKTPKAVKASTQLARREVKANAPARTGRYRDGWASSTKRNSADIFTGTVYNKDVPGLPHLLEKGHAKVGGGRVPGEVHIAPAAEKAFQDFERRIDEVVSSL